MRECPKLPEQIEPFYKHLKTGCCQLTKKILKMGVLNSQNYDELVEWASGIRDGPDEKPYPRIKQENVSANSGEAKPRGACHNCGKLGHFIKTWRAPKRGNRTAPTCLFCNKVGHTEATCWSKHGRPSQLPLPPAPPLEGGN